MDKQKLQNKILNEIESKAVEVLDHIFWVEPSKLMAIEEWKRNFKNEDIASWVPPIELQENTLFLNYWLNWVTKKIEDKLVSGYQKNGIEGLIQKVGIENFCTEELIIKACKLEPKILNWIPKHWRAQKGFDRKCIDANIGCIVYANEQERADRDLLFRAVRVEGSWLYYAVNDLKGDNSLVLEAVKKSGASALQFASDRLLEDEEFLLECIEIDPHSYSYGRGKARRSQRCIELSVARNPECMQYVQEEWIGEEVAKKAIKKNALIYLWLPEELKKRDAFIGWTLKEEPQLWSCIPKVKRQEELIVLKMWENLLNPELSQKKDAVIEVFEQEDIPNFVCRLSKEKRMAYARYLSKKIQIEKSEQQLKKRCIEALQLKMLMFNFGKTDEEEVIKTKKGWGLEVWRHLLQEEEVVGLEVGVDDEILSTEPWFYDCLSPEKKNNKRLLMVAQKSMSAIVLGNEGNDSGEFGRFFNEILAKGEAGLSLENTASLSRVIQSSQADRSKMLEHIWGMFLTQLEGKVLEENIKEVSEEANQMQKESMKEDGRSKRL